MTSCRNKLVVCASSDGGPDLNLGEQSAGNSTFGTTQRNIIGMYTPLQPSSSN